MRVDDVISSVLYVTKQNRATSLASAVCSISSASRARSANPNSNPSTLPLSVPDVNKSTQTRWVIPEIDGRTKHRSYSVCLSVILLRSTRSCDCGLKYVLEVSI